MTRRDFQLIADCVRAVRVANAKDPLTTLVVVLADRLEATNPRFDRYRFAEACKPQEAPMR